jgi:hypothetical protein
MAGVSFHFDSMQAMISKIQGLMSGGKLPGLTNGPTLQEKLNLQIESNKLPTVLVAPWGAEKINDITGILQLDNFGYPTGIAIIADVTAAGMTQEKRLGWRQTIMQALTNSDPGLVEMGGYSFNWVTQPMPIVDPDAWRVNKWVSGIVVWSYVSQPRL